MAQSIDSLLNQTVTLYRKTTYNREGRENTGAAVSVSARFVEVSKSKLLPNQQVIVIDAMAFFRGDETIELNDKITYGSVDYKVLGKKVARGRDGGAHHLECELVKWRSTT